MKVFISSADQDEKLARQIAAGLRKAGFEIFHDTYVLPGENWADKIAQALRESEAMVVLLTPEALQSNKVRRSIEYALGDVAYEGRLIPVVVGSPGEVPEESLPWILQRLQRVNLPERGKPEREIKQIARALLNAA